MNELEIKIYQAIDGHGIHSMGETRAVAIEVAKIALEEIKAAFSAGENYGMHNVGVYKNLEEYLKQKGYE